MNFSSSSNDQFNQTDLEQYDEAWNDLANINIDALDESREICSDCQ